MSEQLFDPGLQPERTELAWRRTLLALAVGGIFALRLLPGTLGAWSIGAALAGLVLTGLLWVLAGRRARTTRSALLHDHQLPGAGLLLLLANLITVGALLGLLYVLIG
ncbi:hypothetical protein GCM10009616_06590 [Microlunatus lacustris]